MKYIEEFRNGDFAKVLSKEIAAQVNPNQSYQFMEFCGGHTHAIHRYGIPSLLPNNIEMIHGPGCPVCVLPMTITDKAIALSTLPNVILSTYADMMRVPGTGQKNLLHAKALGADIRMIYSANDALKIAQENPQKEVIFFAIGFETTTPPTALVIKQAKKLKLSNFSVFCNHVLTPVAMNSLLQSDEVKLDGFVGPAHVSIVIGSRPYEAVCKKYHKPIVISGFEPLDLLHSILMLIKQLNEKRCEVEIQYTRAVNHIGNATSQEIMTEVLELRDQFEWRGLGFIPKSALKIRAEYAEFDAEQRFQLPDSVSQEHKQCLCGEVLRGVKKPMECKLFAKACVPENPLGSCMVSSEGACAAVYAYGRINA
ncbi:hydrogenase expression/formation protein HypD [Legionella gratiana]|uniref:Hydrogenase maturation factor n=1 Tax=Legionella gratiana TaxID=45066 RepID=A0A378JGM1_9GAMM|nr:hydrogenase formation protein HypD [Legionella gratiana]KTD13692.1 hydrogenase expression/formation protein HypD [Legionella gratiana]STX45997.1 hydrogenase expression/formation protein HypD [Legionella gratiana]